MRILTVDIADEIAREMVERADVELMSLARRQGVQTLVAREDSSWAFHYPAGSKLSWRARQSVRRAILEFQPDVVQAFLSRSIAHAVLATIGMPRPPKIVAFRGITTKLSRRDPANWITFLNPRIDGFACESEAIRQAVIESGIPAERCWVTYNGVASSSAGRRSRESILEQLNVPPEAFVVGTVAKMRRVKGMDLLLEAAIECSELRDVYWVLLGEVADPLVRKLAADPRIKDRVRLPGYLPEARKLISAADLFVMPSRSEGLCRALLEAMDAGVCPVVSDAGGMKEVVRHGRDGLVFGRESVAGMVEAIRTLYEDRELAETYAASAKRRIAESFSCRQAAERMLGGFRRLLEKESPGSRRVA
ncbi:MAG: glycosyltransferase family 4 protein [Planctomycetales bacterium]|nr:glycosyltransferase family 4 protein [Planctomycetales bacterium]